MAWFKKRSSSLRMMGVPTGLAYLLAIGILWVVLDAPRTLRTVRLKVLNRFRPASVQGLVDCRREDRCRSRVLRDHLFYYQKVAEYVPHRADAYGLQGFCYYHLGKTALAIEAYQKAVQIDDRFFWFYYNLGVIYFREGRYQEAYDYWKQALHKPLGYAARSIQRSRRLYAPLVAARVSQGESLKGIFQEAYQTCLQRLAMLQQYFFNRPEYQEVFPTMKPVLELF